MNLYNFNIEAYNKIVEIFKIRFYKEIKDTGIVFEEILLADNLVTKTKFYILICNDQETTHYIRFRDAKSLLLQLIQIAQKRLKRLEAKEFELIKIKNVETYGETQYFNDTEMTAIGISSIKLFLHHIEKINKESNK